MSRQYVNVMMELYACLGHISIGCLKQCRPRHGHVTLFRPITELRIRSNELYLGGRNGAGIYTLYTTSPSPENI